MGLEQDAVDLFEPDLSRPVPDGFEQRCDAEVLCASEDAIAGAYVVADLAGNFVTGFRLGANQLQGVLKTGHLF